jgi:hypothetical protein
MGSDLHRTTTTILSIALIVLGVAMIVRTLAAGGGVLATGLLLGSLFILAGVGRVWLARGRR